MARRLFNSTNICLQNIFFIGTYQCFWKNMMWFSTNILKLFSLDSMKFQISLRSRTLLALLFLLQSSSKYTMLNNCWWTSIFKREKLKQQLQDIAVLNRYLFKTSSICLQTFRTTNTHLNNSEYKYVLAIFFIGKFLLSQKRMAQALIFKFHNFISKLLSFDSTNSKFR